MLTEEEKFNKIFGKLLAGGSNRKISKLKNKEQPLQIAALREE